MIGILTFIQLFIFNSKGWGNDHLSNFYLFYTWEVFLTLCIVFLVVNNYTISIVLLYVRRLFEKANSYRAYLHFQAITANVYHTH
ncbi:hypothetical protein HXA34_06370 [Salipaludibacillus agaradhaerens]|uniref:Uncharacterized protein n=1 Tax=Salipaludibacillus agaradhaerens TaxID=76935 RepID=A0A9Q4B2Q6_SALAG|nr:hypothetical protein [Salipaludibacillus agaradhaerens]MCR6097259.1 hypothetical protein [Salipaludibacillus agaradhaerens]MCR6105919.1 hypothetical protein [Salipaludibacillus agaradhaerens]MCR6113256.1 hypothetical protein [Salipaludibacillus agaradhaerens]MCR6117952.1 hypothetical protein [Salipaludibacillus agaradhaerens]